jgi:hypothetical protein
VRFQETVDYETGFESFDKKDFSKEQTLEYGEN